MSTISIITPVYNGEQYIKKYYRSINSQTLNDIEIVIVDDGSTDQTRKLVQELMGSDERIIYIYKKNEGAGIARNIGVENANGHYVFFLDIDDELPSMNTLKMLYETAEKNDVNICGGTLQAPEGDIDESKYHYEKEGIIYFKEYQYDYGFFRFIYSREFLIKNKICFPKYRTFEDPVFLVKALHAAQSFYVCNQCVYIYNGVHHSELDAEKTIDYLKGLKEILFFSAENQYQRLYQINYDRLITQGQYYAEKNYSEKPEEIFEELLQLNTIINRSKIGKDTSANIVLPALATINKMAYKYSGIRNNRFFKTIRKIWRAG